MARKPPSPCIDVCKYKLRGHCIACSMTKMQKEAAKRARTPEARLSLLRLVLAQQAMLGRSFAGWHATYRAKCARKGVECPIDALAAEAADADASAGA